MALAGLPFALSTAGTTGDEAASPLAVSGILADDVLVAVIRHDAANGEIEGLDVSDFTVAAGTITAGTIDTTGYNVLVMWTTPAADPVSS